MKERKFYTR